MHSRTSHPAFPWPLPCPTPTLTFVLPYNPTSAFPWPLPCPTPPYLPLTLALPCCKQQQQKPTPDTQHHFASTILNATRVPLPTLHCPVLILPALHHPISKSLTSCLYQCPNTALIQTTCHHVTHSYTKRKMQRFVSFWECCENMESLSCHCQHTHSN